MFAQDCIMLTLVRICLYIETYSLKAKHRFSFAWCIFESENFPIYFIILIEILLDIDFTCKFEKTSN